MPASCLELVTTYFWIELGRYLQNTRNPDNLNEVLIFCLWFYGQPQCPCEAICLSRTLNEDLFKNHTRETPQLQPCTSMEYSKCWFLLLRGNRRDGKGISRRKWRIKLNQLDGNTACLRIPHSRVVRTLNALKLCAWQWFGELIWLKTLIIL